MSTQTSPNPLTYKKRRIFANSLQFTTLYDEIFLVEDDGFNGFYERLFTKLFPRKRIKIFNAISITGKGGKQELIDFYNTFLSFDQEFRQKCSFKIILDPDFQLIENIPPFIDSPLICYLDKYTIENYLIDEESIGLELQKYYPDKTLDEILGDLEINKWYLLVKDFSELFSYFYLNYYVWNIYHTTVVNAGTYSMNQKEQIIKKKCEIDNKYQKKYIQCFNANLLNENALATYKKTLNSIRLNTKQKIRSEPIKFICGKHLVRSLYHYLRKKPSFTRISTYSPKIFTNSLFTTMIDNRSTELFLFLVNIVSAEQ